MNLYYLALSLCLVSCTNKGCNKKEEKPVLHEAPSEVPAVKNQITEFPTLNLADLSKEQLGGLTKLFNDEICPCACPKTFAQCLLMEKGCKPGIMLAQWAADQLKLGHPERYVFQGLTEEISSGYLATPLQVKTDGAYQKGNKNAPLTIIEFADFECPACRVAHLAISNLVKNNDQKVQLYFMHFPLSAHPNAERAAIAAEAAGLQGKFWEMHDLLFTHEGPLSDAAIKELAQKLFDVQKMAQFEKDLKRDDIAKKVKGHRDHAMNDLKLLGTPAFLFNGRPYNLTLTENGLKLRLEMEQLREKIDCQVDGN